MTALKRFLERLLAVAARRILHRYQPQIIGVTGTVGKTTVKEFVAAALAGSKVVRANAKNYNNEIGLPLSIIGVETGGRSFIKWISVFCQALWLIAGPRSAYPDILVLEMGVDHPGNMDTLTAIALPTIGIVTAITPVHMAFFASLEELATEKMKILRAVSHGGSGFANADDDVLRALHTSIGADITTVGWNNDADIRIKQCERIDGSYGLSATIRIGEERISATFPFILARHQLYAPLFALAVAQSMGISIAEALKRVADRRPPAGRMNVIDGIKRTVIIDDSYNASPEAAKRAIDTLHDLPCTGKRWAVLGVMAEMGTDHDRYHEEVGRYAYGNVDILVVVGEDAARIADGARHAGMDPSTVMTFATTDEAGQAIQSAIHPGDIILIKGSQAARMEHVARELMADPLRAGELLVRQGPEWSTISP